MRKTNKKRADEDELMYRLLLVLLAILFLYLLVVVIFHLDLRYGVLCQVPCPVHALTGGYCPGCGGTRAVFCLLQGDLWGSLRYHPLVPYLAGGIAIFLLSHTLKHLTRGRIRGIHFHARFLYIGLGIMLVNMAVKNYCYFVLGISLIE